VVDFESSDDRLLSLPAAEVRALAMAFIHEARVALAPVAATASLVIDHLFGRCRREWM
jgi:hypothetical protein